MNKNLNIDDLFKKAAIEPAHTSFAETKARFEASLKISGAQTGLLTKKWIIMSIISAIIITGTLLFWHSNETGLTSTEEIQEKKHEQSENHKNAIVLSEDSLLSETHRNDMKKIADVENLPLKKIDTKLPKSGVLPIKVQGLTKGKKSKEYKDEYRFPKLTEDEIKENEKRKKNMLKKLANLDKDEYSYIPSGSILYKGKPTSIQAFYIQTHEVSNIEYKTYLFDLLIHDRKDEFLIAAPDQDLWYEIPGALGQQMQRDYFTVEEFEDYPVVNISREGAQLYCIWLTKEVRNYKDGKRTDSFNDLRIPYVEEWTYAASSKGQAGIFAWGDSSLVNQSNCFLANCALDKVSVPLDSVTCDHKGSENALSTAGFMMGDNYCTTIVRAYNPNENGLYNMSGNVAEMVVSGKEREPGTAGGGWRSSPEDLTIEAEDPYSGVIEPNLNIGFRVVMTYRGIGSK